MTDSSASSDGSSVPLWPGGSAPPHPHPPGLFIFLQLSVGVRGARAQHRKGDLQGDFPESVLPVTKALDRTSSPVTTHWGLAEGHVEAGTAGKLWGWGWGWGGLTLPSALWRLANINVTLEDNSAVELVLGNTVSASFA